MQNASFLGQSIKRIDARAKVTGQAHYPGDLTMPGMAHAKVLFARRPHARVRKIDTSAALAVPGVLGIFTGADVPNNEYGLVLFDAPVMVSALGNEPLAADAPQNPNSKIQTLKSFDGVVRHIGEKMAIIVAETEKIAEHARSLIKIDYEDLPIISSIHDAIKPDAPQLHPHYPGNVIQRYRVRRGDVEAGFAQADVIVEDTYWMGAQEHAYLQPEAGLAYMDEAGRLTIQVAGQWTHEDQEQIAHALKLPLDQVRVIYPAIGGAFGGREDMSVQIVLCLAVQRLNRPVKIIWTREESMIGHHKRHPYWVHAKLGATKDGKLVAVQINGMSDAGPYNYTSNKVLGNFTSTCIGPYAIPNVAIDSAAVVTNNVPSGAFRGFGAPQGLFVAETQINKMAAALGMDPVALRQRNCWQEGTITAFNTPVPPGCSLGEVISTCAENLESKIENGKLENAAPNSSFSILNSKFAKGTGFACGHKNIGFSFGYPENSACTIELRGNGEIEQAIVGLAGADCGQGAHTAFLQIAAEALGLPHDKIELQLSDTSTSGSSGSASASRLTYMTAGAIVGAAKAALAKWQDEERPVKVHHVYRPRPTTQIDPKTGEGDPNITYAYIAQSAEVEVDTETGQVHVRNFVCADDVGRAVNPQQIVGQIEGAVSQGLGYAVLENFVTEGGYVKTAHFSTYLIPSVLDMPDRVKSVIVEHPDPTGTLGIRGMAELPLMIVAPAIVAAIHDATGVWVNELPVTPERLRKALKAKG
ncbi:MAG: xanthine dehydrogenase family protein molybdopterin-binding subunit [Anaerolineae bacterium]|nr:xanthine dehydrogenase family protein molybdopterin-binding subunit [Anaerolineae bacterium]